MLMSEIKELDIVTNQDFFPDRLANLNEEAETFFKNIKAVTKNKGESIDYVIQHEPRRGNAVNDTPVLAALGHDHATFDAPLLRSTGEP